MADVRTVTDRIAVAGQVRPEEVAGLADRFTLLINNRPDGEEAGQPASAELEAAASAVAVPYRHIPISGAPGPEQVRAMQGALEQANGPALAFCRTGTRSITAWALGEALAGRSTDELIQAGGQAGYDLGPALTTLLPRLRP